MGQQRKGFTLLELLMVVIIIGILVSIALPQFVKTTERSRAAQMLPLLATIRGAEIRYYASDPTNAYTTTLSLLDITVPAAAQLPAGWDTATGVTVTVGTPSLVKIKRTSGSSTVNTKSLEVNIDTGNPCADDPAAAAIWGVSASC